MIWFYVTAAVCLLVFLRFCSSMLELVTYAIIWMSSVTLVSLAVLVL